MTIEEHKSLAPFTTFRIGGEARFFIEAETIDDVQSAVAFAREQGLPLRVLGRGSNLLVPDTKINAVVVKVAISGIEERDTPDGLYVTAGAGVLWDDLVDYVATRGVFGIENLAGIPGSVGGAVVQNIGAYGTEFATVFVSAEVVDALTGARETIDHDNAEFAYRTSFFKTHPEKIITSVTMRFVPTARANTEYAGFASAKEQGVPLTTPQEIARAVRGIRAEKFPDLSKEGTAGSFFKNPILTSAHAEELKARFPGLPTYPHEAGIKIPVAWILDHILNLKGYTLGRTRLYEQQPLVLVAMRGASAAEVEALAREVADRVREVTGILLEREVETFEV